MSGILFICPGCVSLTGPDRTLERVQMTGGDLHGYDGEWYDATASHEGRADHGVRGVLFNGTQGVVVYLGR